MSRLADKKAYMEQVAKGKAHRQISKNTKFSVSASIIRDELLKDGLIVPKKTVLHKNSGDNYVYFELSGKKLEQDDTPQFWSCGTPRSRGNAFDWANGKSSLFTKQDIANAANKGKPANYNPYPISAYTRA